MTLKSSRDGFPYEYVAGLVDGRLENRRHIRCCSVAVWFVSNERGSSR